LAAAHAIIGYVTLDEERNTGLVGCFLAEARPERGLGSG